MSHKLAKGEKNSSLNLNIGKQFIHTCDEIEISDFLCHFRHTDTSFNETSRHYRVKGYFVTTEMPDKIPQHFLRNSKCTISIDNSTGVERSIIEVLHYLVEHELPF